MNRANSVILAPGALWSAASSRRYAFRPELELAQCPNAVEYVLEQDQEDGRLVWRLPQQHTITYGWPCSVYINYKLIRAIAQDDWQWVMPAVQLSCLALT